LNDSGKEISEYIAQRKEDYVKSKEREREAVKVVFDSVRKYIYSFVYFRLLTERSLAERH